MDHGYEKVGVLDIGNMTSDVWGDAAKRYLPHSSKVMYVLKRRQSAAPGSSF
jgi:hypothetical protein